MHLKYPQLLNHRWLLGQLKTKTRAELAEEYGFPYNSINNQVKQFSPEMKAQILSGRFTWSPSDKLAIIKEAEKRGYQAICSEHGIDRSQLSHWRRELSDKGLLPGKPLRRGRPPERRKRKRAG